MIILLIFIFVLLAANFVVLLYLASFLVRQKEMQDEFNADLVNAIGNLVELPSPSPAKPGWEDKYEDELDAAMRRIRANSGLKDLPDPMLNWGEPPAPNTNNMGGLTIEDK